MRNVPGDNQEQQLHTASQVVSSAVDAPFSEDKV